MNNTSRQRMLDAFNYNNPDKIPLVYHPSRAGLYVHGEKLLDLFNKYPSDNPIVHNEVPVLAPEAFDANGDYHELITDEWGTRWEYRIFGITGHPKAYPFDSWREALEKFQFPPLAETGSLVFAQDRDHWMQHKQNYLIFNGWISIFEKLHALRPFDEVLMDLFMNNPDLMDFLEKMTDYWLKTIDYYAAIGTDVYVFGDDYGTQNSTMISPEMYRDIFKPIYKKLFERVREHGGLPFLHSCGYLGEIMNEFIDLGVRGLWPQLNIYDNDTEFIERCRANNIACYLHPDRQYLMPLGTPAEIERYIARLAERYHKMEGGGIFYVEIENDAPFENVKTLFESIDKYR